MSRNVKFRAWTWVRQPSKLQLLTGWWVWLFHWVILIHCLCKNCTQISLPTSCLFVTKALPAWLLWTPASKVMLDGASKASRSQGINLRQHLALMDPSDQLLGPQLPWSRRPTSPWMPVSEETRQEVRGVVVWCAEQRTRWLFVTKEVLHMCRNRLCGSVQIVFIYKGGRSGFVAIRGHQIRPGQTSPYHITFRSSN